MSRFNQNDYTQVNKDTEFYSDVLVGLDAHPQKHDLARNINANAVKRSIKNLIMTNKYERLFNPRIGSKIRNLLFEDVSTFTQVSLKQAITETIENYEPRAKLVDVVVTPYVDQQAYVITIVFYIINNIEPITFQTTLYRVR